MIRALALATLLLVASDTVLVQSPVVLHIRVTVLDGERGSVPVARHVLLISDVPVSGAPHRAVTSVQGTADVNLIPGRYIVESDRATSVGDRSYEWSQVVDVVAGRETTLALTAGNARVGTATPEMLTAAVAPAKSSPLTLLPAWQQSVVTLWTPRTYASGFLLDARGLVATSQRAIGDATAVEVQISATVKVAATVLATDAARDVAILQIDPSTVAGVRPVPLTCEPTSASRLLDDSELLTIEVRLLRPTDVISVPSSEIAGGPVFAPDGAVVGLTSSSLEAGNGQRRGETRVIGADAVCAALAAAESKMPGPTPPNSTRLPVESGQSLPAAALTAAVAGRAFTATPYRISSSDFDIVFITPLLRAAAEAQQDRMAGGDAGLALRALVDFGTWAEYVEKAPALLLVRVTPRVVENVWMKVARGAASTQGMALPPIKRMRPGFSAMKVVCDGRTITPIHPFKIQRRLSETEGIDEGLYVFDPAAIGPQCGKVSLVLSSVKEPGRTETRAVDPAVVRRIAQDFASSP